MSKQITFQQLKDEVLMPFLEVRIDILDEEDGKKTFYELYNQVNNVKDLMESDLLDGFDDDEVLKMVQEGLDKLFFKKD